MSETAERAGDFGIAVTIAQTGCGVNRIEPVGARVYAGAEPGRMKEVPMSQPPVAQMSFEQAMKELEEVVTKLERGDVPLEDSIKLYERGAELKKRCEDKLREAEQKVAAITLDADANPTGTIPVEDK